MPRKKPVAPTEPNPISRAELARRAGKSRSRVTEDCRTLLRSACLVGGEVDLAHPAVAEWAARRGIELAALRAKASAAAARPPEGHAVARHGDEYTALTLRKRRAEVEKLELRNARDRAMLVSRELVRTHVFGALDGLHRRLLTDVCSTLPTKIAALVRSGASAEDLKAAAREHFYRELLATSRQMTRGMKRVARAARRNEPLSDEHDDDEDNETEDSGRVSRADNR
jgi:hypothetical protein